MNDDIVIVGKDKIVEKAKENVEQFYKDLEGFFCYCKKCEKPSKIKSIIIDDKDRQTIRLECGHKRVYQLITSSEDYK